MKGINVLSLFDGMSCGRTALEKVNIKVDNYFASEIDKYAIEIAKKNYPNIKHIGSVIDVKGNNLPKIDLLIGGSPCQDLRPGRDGLKGEKSKLFYEYYRLWKECKPEYFLLENVGKISKEDKQIITNLLGIEPNKINSNLFSAQNRDRYYWTNIPINNLPESNSLLLQDVLEKDVIQKYFVKLNNYIEGSKQLNSNYKSQANTIHELYKKSPTLCAFTHGYAQGYVKDFYLNDKEIERGYYKYSAKTWKSGNKMGNMTFPDSFERKSKTLCSTVIKADRATHHIKDKYGIRRLTPIEFERLQTVPDNYTEGVSNTQRYKMLGNGWTVDVIAHIFKGLPKEWFNN